MSDEMGRREFIRQGTVAGMFASTGLPFAQVLGQQPVVAAGASRTDTVSAIAPATRALDSKAFCLSEYDAIERSLTFTATTRADADAWQRRARQRLVERIGGFPTTRAPLNAEVLETTDCGSYVREKIVFDTRHNLSALGYLLVPKGGSRPLPAVVCFSGHGRGLPDILGPLDAAGPRPERTATYAREYALQCVEHGYVTFAVEQLGLGSRRDDAARAAGPAENSCRPAACAALLFGQSMAGWRVWDAMRAIDYLGQRSEVDMARIATLGASGGGTTSLLAGALDERVKVTVVSAYFNTFRDSIVSISHCPDNYVPGLLQDMEMSDLAGLVAPRRLFVESGRHDRIFPIDGSQAAVDHARSIYAAFGVSDRLGYAVHDGAHEFNGVAAFDSLSRWLQDRPS
ncbi:alpha/beta hydrolase family protein [soil metagenome]